MSTSMLQAFRFETKELRVHLTGQGEQWWVANDLCQALGIKNPRDAVSRLDEDERAYFDTKTGAVVPVGQTDAFRRAQSEFPTFAETNSAGFTPADLSGFLNIVSEAGLYSLIMSAGKPEAKAFKRWVTHEVLPEISRTGRYESEAFRSQQNPEPSFVGPGGRGIVIEIAGSGSETSISIKIGGRQFPKKQPPKPAQKPPKPVGRPKGSAKAMVAAMKWVEGYLKDGPAFSRNIIPAGMKMGHSRATLFRALGQVAVKFLTDDKPSYRLPGPAERFPAES